MGSFLNGINGISRNALAIAEISLHPSNYIGGGPSGQGVELPVRVCGKLAPESGGIKIG